MTGRRRAAVTLGRYLGLLPFIGFAGFPLYWMVSTVTVDPLQLYARPQSLLLDVRRLGNLFDVFRSDSSPLVAWLKNSLFIAAGTTILSLLLAVTVAYALSRYKFVGRGVLGFIMFATQMLPQAMLVVPLYAAFVALGLLNAGGVVLAVTAFTMPIAVWIIKTAIDSVPVEIEEAARVDGCPSFGILSMVTLPLVAPSLAAAAVLCFFDGWNEFMFATTFIQEKDKWAASTGLAAFVGEFVTPINTVFAAAVWFTLPAVVFFLLLQRRIIGGLSAGSVKG
jgi:multiple sugar transport system permease protein